LLHETILRRVSMQHFPGGSLNFERFETEAIDDCVKFIQDLIERSANINGVSIMEMKKGVKIMATGGGAHRFYELFRDTLGVEILREDEMECLIEGLKFITLIPDEVYFFSDELIQSVAHPSPSPVPRTAGSNPTEICCHVRGKPDTSVTVLTCQHRVRGFHHQSRRGWKI
jgi:type II pantothenate kinase